MKKILDDIPDDRKDEFYRQIYAENLYRILFAAVFLITGEFLIYLFLKEKIFRTDLIVLSFIIFNIFCLPLIYQCYKNHDTYRMGFLLTIQLIFFGGNLCLACALSIFPQSELITINPYIIALFAFAALITISPLTTISLLVIVYAGFFYFLPFYQKNPGIALVLQLNAFFMNCLALLLSRLIFRFRVSAYMDRQIIEEQNKMLKKIAVCDSMTLLLNHENILKKLSEETDRVKRIGYRISIIMIDIDHFKNINDKYGHLTGDHVIIKISQIITSTCRATDVVGRYGGEEYLIIAPDTAVQEAVVLAERIRINIQSAEFPEGIKITISGGVSEYKYESIEEFIRDADRKLYQAKSEGRNLIKT